MDHAGATLLLRGKAQVVSLGLGIFFVPLDMDFHAPTPPLIQMLGEV
jgi:hypothetical protein